MTNNDWVAAFIDAAFNNPQALSGMIEEVRSEGWCDGYDEGFSVAERTYYE